MTKKRYAIGIDPGIQTGFAIWDRNDKEIASKRTLTFWELMDWFSKPADATRSMIARMEIIIEIPSGHVIHRRAEENAKGFGRDRQAANVGSNRREAVLLAEGLERLGFEVRRVTPTRTKWTAKDLKQRTGITERTNQHVRDAIALVYGL